MACRVAQLTVCLAFVNIATAFAQGPATRKPAPRGAAIEQRVFISIDPAVYLNAREFDETVTFRENAEDGAIDASYPVATGPVLNLSGGAVVWGNLAVAVGVTRFSTEMSVPVTATIPHPFFFNQPREIEGEALAVQREELAIHVQARMVVPMGNRWQVMVFGGPTFFTVKHGLVNEVEWTEAYPYDEAAFQRVVIADVEESKVGVNLGGDVAYYFMRHLGVGGGVMYSGTQIDLTSGGRTVEVKVGGVVAGGGLRLRF